MRHLGKFVLLSGVVFFLFACTPGSNNGEKAKIDDTKELRTNEEVKAIIHENFKEMSTAMDEVHAEYKEDWSEPNQKWIYNPNEDEEGFEEPKRIGTAALESHVDEQFLDTIVKEYLQAYFCNCDRYHIFSSSDADIRFEVLEQDDSYVKARAIRLYDYIYENPGTFTYEYIKDGDNWKLLDVAFVTTEEEPLNITFEDVEYYIDYETEKKKETILVEEYEEDGTDYLVIKRDGWIDVMDKENSKLNYHRSVVLNGKR